MSPNLTFHAQDLATLQNLFARFQNEFIGTYIPRWTIVYGAHKTDTKLKDTFNLFREHYQDEPDLDSFVKKLSKLQSALNGVRNKDKVIHIDNNFIYLSIYRILFMRMTHMLLIEEINNPDRDRHGIYRYQKQFKKEVGAKYRSFLKKTAKNRTDADKTVLGKRVYGYFYKHREVMFYGWINGLDAVLFTLKRLF